MGYFMGKTFVLGLLALTAVGTACTQQQNVADNSRKNSTIRHGSYVQTGSHLPGAYREDSTGPDLSQSELQREELTRLQNQGATIGMPTERSAGGGL